MFSKCVHIWCMCFYTKGHIFGVFTTHFTENVSLYTQAFHRLHPSPYIIYVCTFWLVVCSKLCNVTCCFMFACMRYFEWGNFFWGFYYSAGMYGSSLYNRNGKLWACNSFQLFSFCVLSEGNHNTKMIDAENRASI